MNWIPFFDDQYPVRTFYTDKEDYEKSGSGDSDSYMQYLQDARGIRVRQVVPAFETHCASVYVVDREPDQETDHMGNAGEKHNGRLAYVDDSLCVDGPGGYDSVVTSVPGIMLTIRTADCTPVYLYDPAHHVAAMVHSGWRGTLQKISVNTIRVMEDLFHTEPGQVIAAFGPCICGHCYEVGADLLNLFRDRYEPDEIKRIFNPREETGRISPKASPSGEAGNTPVSGILRLMMTDRQRGAVKKVP